MQFTRLCRFNPDQTWTCDPTSVTLAGECDMHAGFLLLVSLGWLQESRFLTQHEAGAAQPDNTWGNIKSARTKLPIQGCLNKFEVAEWVSSSLIFCAMQPCSFVLDAGFTDALKHVLRAFILDLPSCGATAFKNRNRRQVFANTIYFHWSKVRNNVCSTINITGSAYWQCQKSVCKQVGPIHLSLCIIIFFFQVDAT